MRYDPDIGRALRLRTHAVLSLIIILVLAGLLGTSARWSATSQPMAESPVPADQKAVLCSMQESFSAIADRARPGVVSITAVQRIEKPTVPGSGNPEELFRRFFEDRLGRRFDSLEDQETPLIDPEPSVVTAAGSGTIVQRKGNDFYVLTNYHVVEGAYEVTVRLSDETDLKGIVIGIDPVTDLAVVRISSPKLTDRNVVPMGDSSDVKVGSWALAVGSPFGFEQTLTVGVVSGLHREIEDEETSYPDLIQTDASINKGNSGGPLLDVEGRIIGVNAAIASPTGSFIGIGFAVPINSARAVLDDLIDNGRVVRGWLGVGIQDLSPVMQEYYGASQGVLVATVDEDGPAAKAGIADEDVITQVGETQVGDVRQLQRLIANTAPGSSVSVAVARKGSALRMPVRIGLSPSTPVGRPTPQPEQSGPGIRVRTLSGELAGQLGLGETHGVIVVEVMPGSPAEEAGLEDGDIVVAFNGRKVEKESTFAGMLADVKRGGIVMLRVVREDSPRMIGFRPE
jgi:serine protease Do